MLLPDGRYAKVTHLRIYGSYSVYPIRDAELKTWAEKEKRPYSGYREGKIKPLAQGGRTIVQILDRYDQEHVVAEGFATCNPTDNYSKKRGRDIALGRAMKQLA